jgi:hypothetical protein
MLHHAHFARAHRSIARLFPDAIAGARGGSGAPDEALVLAHCAGAVLHTRIDTAPASLTKAQLLLFRDGVPLARPDRVLLRAAAPLPAPRGPSARKCSSPASSVRRAWNISVHGRHVAPPGPMVWATASTAPSACQ